MRLSSLVPRLFKLQQLGGVLGARLSLVPILCKLQQLDGGLGTGLLGGGLGTRLMSSMVFTELAECSHIAAIVDIP